MAEPQRVTPLSRELPDAEWKGGETPSRTADFLEAVRAADSQESVSAVLEKIIGVSNLVDIYRLRLAAQLATGVGLVRRADRGSGTGFLIAPDRLLTNNHVLEDQRQAEGGVVLMDYERGERGQRLPPTPFDLAPERYFHTNADLDYSIVAINREVPTVTPEDSEESAAYKRREAARAVFTLDEGDLGTLEENRDVFIIQHPLGQPKMIAAADNQVRYVGPTFVQYLTDTEPGSSGSPVLDEWFRLVALHHAGGHLHDPRSNRAVYRNQGINIRAIVDDMPDDFRADRQPS